MRTEVECKIFPTENFSMLDICPKTKIRTQHVNLQFSFDENWKYLQCIENSVKIKHKFNARIIWFNGIPLLYRNEDNEDQEISCNKPKYQINIVKYQEICELVYNNTLLKICLDHCWFPNDNLKQNLIQLEVELEDNNKFSILTDYVYKLNQQGYVKEVNPISKADWVKQIMIKK